MSEIAEFKDWYDAVWLGDQEHGQEVPTNPSHPQFKEYLSGYTLALGAWQSARAPLLARIAELEAKVAEETKRLDYVLDNYGYMESSKTDAGGIAWQLMTQDEDENYIVLSGETKFFTTKRAAIDAAIRGNEK
jgi:hypothetical protein